MQDTTIISETRDCIIGIMHRKMDGGSWIVRRWRKFLWFRKRVSSDWFLDEQQARAFANRMKLEYARE